MDSNGYNDSLFDTEDGTCFLTGVKCDTARHEIFGASNRKNSKRDGLWIAVMPFIHDLIHRGQYEWLKPEAEKLWLMEDWSRSIQDFVDKYGKNYL